MASNSRPLLLDLRDEDFQRGYTGSRPPSLISPEPKRSVAPETTTVAPPRSGKGKTVALFLAAIAASVITSKLLSNSTAEHTTVGVEAAQKVEAARVEVAPPAAPIPSPVAAPVVAEVKPPVVQAAVVAPVAPQPKPIAAAAAPKPIAKAAAPAKSAEEAPAETKDEAKAATPTFGVEEAGF